MKRNLRQAAGVFVANAALLVAACASEVAPDVGNPMTGGSSGEAEGGKGGSGGGGGSAAGATNGGMAGTSAGGSAGGTANGGAGADPPVGGNGGTGGASGGAMANGGTAGSAGAGGGAGAGGMAGAGGTGGAGGASGAAGAGGVGGSAAGASGAGGTGGGAVNLINNSGFETNTTGWSVFGGSATIATSTDQAHAGTRSLLITGRTQTYQGPQYSVLSVVTPGTSYSVSLWARLAASTPTGSLTVTLHYTCSGGSAAGDNYQRWVDTTAASASSWTQLTGVQTFPTCDGGTLSAASLYVESPSATLSYYIDDVVLSTP